MTSILICSNALATFTHFRVFPGQLGQIAPMFLKSKPLPQLQPRLPLVLPVSSSNYRCILLSSSTVALHLHKIDPDNLSPTELHSLYHEQMKEIQYEREKIFGSEDSHESSPDSPDFVRTGTGRPRFSTSEPAPQSTQTSSSNNAPQFLPPGWNAEEAYSERESLFAFTEEEQHAWNNRGIQNPQNTAAHNRILSKLIEGEPMNHDHAHDHNDTDIKANNVPLSSSEFSHLTPQGDGVTMVDVGQKTSTRRVALARSVVVFPPEVLSAFQVSSIHGGKSEMIGPKGPIFECAKIAGILGAKKTSDLIPLCHPLPLDRVNIQIELVNNQALIECECCVTHTTGVEMEALTGAAIAALTIYDMVKAVSHRVEIGPTILVSKSGGKSDFVRVGSEGKRD